LGANLRYDRAILHCTAPNPPMSDLRQTNPEKYAALTAEAQAPFRSLRLFVYASCVISAGVGGMVIFLGILAGRNLEVAIPNFAVNAGVVALMTWLFLKENKAKDQAIAEVLAAMKSGGDKSARSKTKKS
jgi:Low psii accumulation1 / Rep27